jgi:hypothetical protein
VPVFAWIALAVFLVTVLGGLAFAGLRGWRAWKTLRRVQGTVGAGMLEITNGIAGAESRLAAAGESAERLDRARAQLKESLATLTLLRTAASDARGALSVAAFLRK